MTASKTDTDSGQPMTDGQLAVIRRWLDEEITSAFPESWAEELLAEVARLRSRLAEADGLLRKCFHQSGVLYVGMNGELGRYWDAYLRQRPTENDDA